MTSSPQAELPPDLLVVHREPVWIEKADHVVYADLSPHLGRPGLEQLWARELPDHHYEVSCLPFLARDLALGDIVKCRRADHKIMVDRVTQPSRRRMLAIHHG